uniref:Putative glycosyltransferase n=1 Tax=Lobelia erinus TaxID=16430 RepID=A4F1T4_LOBER|nr:putative glycosyltransferase [Lobelia erinus]BAF49316.1 putative glycosyltransferase [Lobelia erinus]BAF49317.1 putative glycosyltransferase [Lobelia erinus]
MDNNHLGETLLPLAPKNGRRVLFFPYPLQGHISPMLNLANLLHSKGFTITIIHTNLNSPNQSDYPHFTFRPFDDGFPPYSKGWQLATLCSRCVEPFRECLAQIFLSDHTAPEGERESIACLIADGLWNFLGAAVYNFKLPMIVLRTGNMSNIVANVKLPCFIEKGYFDHTKEGSKLEAAVPEFPTIKFKDILKTYGSNPKAICETLTALLKEMRASSGVIWNSCKELEQSELQMICKEFPVPHFLIGPLHKYFPASSSSLVAHDPSSISWLNSKAPNSVLYVSFGSISSMDEAEFLETAWGLANSMQQFLWVVRPGSVRGSQWLESLPDGFIDKLDGRGHIVKWAPQQEVLAHQATGGFWTHCGWNSTLESMCEGVPMICSHGIMDQPINARYVTDVWKVGIELEKGFDSEEIKMAIRRLMVDKEGQEIRERSSRLKESLSNCLKQGGSSHDSVESLVDHILSF